MPAGNSRGLRGTYHVGGEKDREDSPDVLDECKRDECVPETQHVVRWGKATHQVCKPGMQPRGGLVSEALVSLSLRLKDLLGPVTTVKKEKKKKPRTNEQSSKNPL